MEIGNELENDFLIASIMHRGKFMNVNMLNHQLILLVQLPDVSVINTNGYS